MTLKAPDESSNGAPIARKALVIHPSDGVAVALVELAAGETLALDGDSIAARERIPAGHKLALRDHDAGELVTKYGYPIGRASRPIRAGEHVHSHNLETRLGPEAVIDFAPAAPSEARALEHTWQGYLREDGRAATRNELWIIPTVGCVARTAQALASAFRERLRDFPNIDGVHAFGHAFGCSQLGDDLKNTQKILAGLATHPNAGGALVLGLGCESNNLGVFGRFLERGDQSRLKVFSAQSSADEHEEGLRLLEELARRANEDARAELPTSALVVGLKCGGSDGLSGITANPLLGRFATRLTATGATAIRTEVPEMFGAESALFAHCADREVFERAVRLVRGFRDYYVAHGQKVHENPAPGNKDGGITTLEEKSLGCVQKGGDARITDVVAYG